MRVVAKRRGIRLVFYYYLMSCRRCRSGGFRAGPVEFMTLPSTVARVLPSRIRVPGARAPRGPSGPSSSTVPAVSVSQSVISRSRPALTPPPALNPAPPPPVAVCGKRYVPVVSGIAVSGSFDV